MGFGGSVSAMISSLKANQKLLKKRSRFDANNNRYTNLKGRNKAMVFNELDAKSKNLLNIRLARLRREQKTKSIKVWGLTLLVVILVMSFIYFSLSLLFF